MYLIETVNEITFFIKAIGTFPPSVAENFVKEFEALTKSVKSNLRVIVDITDAILLKIESIEIILNLLKRNNEKLHRSAFVISNNPPLGIEFKHILEKAESPKRKIVNTLSEAKEWVGIQEIKIKK